MSVHTLKKVVLLSLVATLSLGCGSRSEGELIASAKKSIARREYASAIIDLKLAMQQSLNSGEARYLLGVVLLEQGDYAAAIFELLKARDLGFDEDLLAPKLARAWIAIGKFKEVIETHGSVSLKDSKAQGEMMTAVAAAYIKLGQPKLAEASIAAALLADPANQWAMLTRAGLLAAKGDLNEALALTERAIDRSRPSGEAYLLRGHLLLFVKHDEANALLAYRKAAEDPAQTLAARTAAIQLLLKQRKLIEAQSELTLLKKTHPQHGQTAYLDALVSYDAKDFSRTEALIDQLLRVSADNPQMLTLGGAANLQRRAYGAAEAKLGKVVATFEQATLARRLLAETYLQVGKSDKSLAVLKPLLVGGKPDIHALTLAGYAYLQLGDIAHAEEMYSAVAKASPGNSEALTALALTDLAKGNVGPAFDALQSIVDKDPTIASDLALISARMRRREFDAALKAIQNLERKAPGKPLTSFLMGNALVGQGNFDAARKAFEAALVINSNEVPSAIALASLDDRQGRPDEALRRLDALIKANPTNAPAYAAKVSLLTRQGAKPSDIQAAIEAAIRAAPNEPQPRLDKIAHFARMNEVKPAALAAQEALAAMPNDPSVLRAAGWALFSAGDRQQALSAFRRLVDVNPSSAESHMVLADLYGKLGDEAAVAASLRRALDLAPRSSEVHRRLIGEANRVRDYRPALGAAKNIQKLYPNSAAGYLLEGDVESARKAWPKAIAAYRAALDKGDAGSRPQILVYSRLRTAGAPGAADRFITEWLKSHPSDVGFIDHLGNIALLRNDYPKAEQWYREVLRLAPQSPAAMNNLAWLMSERSASGSVEMAEKALALSPGAAPVMDTLAKALASEGNVQRAIAVQSDAIAAMPERHEYRLSLARLYARAGDKAQALAQVEVLEKLSEQSRLRAEAAVLRKSLSK